MRTHLYIHQSSSSTCILFFTDKHYVNYHRVRFALYGFVTYVHAIASKFIQPGSSIET